MIMKNLHRNRILPWLISGGRNYHKPEYEGSNGNIKYLTFDEASYLAKVSRSMINKWADKGKFTVIKVGSRVRILRDEFEDWMEQRDLERSMQ